MSKEAVIFGSGRITPPLIDYLKALEISFTIASNELERAGQLIGEYGKGEALLYDIQDDGESRDLESIIADARVVISMLPYVFHAKVARSCFHSGASMVTPSYSNGEIEEMDRDFKVKGLTVLMEMGLDPGLDHMSTMEIVDAIHREGGCVDSFTSYCGGLPSPEYADNPLKYKFSWSPKGVLMASRSSAVYQQNGEEVCVESGKLHTNIRRIYLPDGTALEGYPNRNSLPYTEKYSIPEAKTIMRGTLRYEGWTETLGALYVLGYLSDDEIALHGKRYIDITAELVGFPGIVNGNERIREQLTGYLGVDLNSHVINSLEWLGLFSEDMIVSDEDYKAPIDLLADIMLEKMQYQDGEKDMVFMIHEIGYTDIEGTRHKVNSELLVYGDEQYSAMARTTGFTSAVGARLLLEGRINRKGVCIPIFSEIYDSVLDEVASLGVVFTKRDERLSFNS